MDLRHIFEVEAQQIDPLFMRYLAVPSKDAGGTYYNAAAVWLADAHRALQDGDFNDPWYIPVSQRFDMVVKNINRITAENNMPDAINLPGFFGELKKNAEAIGDAAKKGITLGFEVGPTLIIGAILLLAVLALGRR